MRVARLEIKNFRCLDDACIEIGDYTVLVGRNGVGKSAFLNALEFFHDHRFKVRDEDFCQVDCDREIEVTAVFTDLSDGEKVEFAKYIRGDELPITKVARGGLGDNHEASYHGNRLQYLGFDYLRDLSGQKFNKAFRVLVKSGEVEGLEQQASETAGRAELERWEEAHPEECEMTRDDGKFFGFGNVAAGKIDRFSRFVRIPAVIDPSQQFDETRSSTIGTLVSVLVRQRGGSAAVIDELRERVRSDYQEIIQRPEFDLAEVEGMITSSLQEFVPEAEAALEWQASKALQIPDPTARVRLREGKLTLPPEYSGHGLLRAYELAVLGMLSEQARAVGDDAQGSGHLIIAVDEPELYQHPSQARAVAMRLMRLAGSEVAGLLTQVICTSHSPLFVTLENCEAIRVVRRPADGGQRGSPTVSQPLLERMAETMSLHIDGPEITAESLSARMACLFHPTLTEAVFADVVLLCEGLEDAAALEGVMRATELHERLTKYGLHITPVYGKENLDRMMVLLADMGVPYYVVFDTDLPQDNEEKRAKAKSTNNRIVRLATGDAGAESPVETSVEERFAAMGPNLTAFLRNACGEEGYDALRARIAENYGYEQPSKAMKSPVFVTAMLRELRERDEIPSQLLKIQAAVAARMGVEI